MAVGAGKYDDLCTKALIETEGDAVLLIVLGGSKGAGFSVATTDVGLLLGLPRILREVAAEIEKDGQKIVN